MAKPRNDVFRRLTALFRGGPMVRRKVKAFRSPSASTAVEIFKKSYSQVYSNALNAYGQYDRMSRYADFSEMEYCLAGDTLIATLDGYRTIKDLAETYGTEREFYVYAFDHEKGGITPAVGKQARQTRTDHAWKVTFDSGKSITGTANHRLMKRDGTYCRIDQLQAGDSMMPFYRLAWYGDGKGTDTGDGYRFIYTVNDGWRREHQVVAEWVEGRTLGPNEVVHHRNFVKHDNRPENLQVMGDDEHRSYHASVSNGKKWSPDNQEWIDGFKRRHSAWMKENNPAERKDITFAKILDVCEQHGFNSSVLCERLDTDPNVIKRKLKKFGFENFETFAAAYCPNWRNGGWDNRGEKNPRFDCSLTFQSICDAYQPGLTGVGLAEKLNTTYAKVRNRLRTQGFATFKDFTENYGNHKVVSIEYAGVIPLYDLTVDGYKNFATDTVISHNTPEISSALDIYAEESTSPDDKGVVLHVYSDNSKIQEILDELFHDILNAEHNMTPWVRNLCKYGDMFLFNDVHPELGVINAFPIPVNEVEREEGWDPNDPLAVRYRWVTQGNQVLDAWNVTHFRLTGNDAFLPYGSSILESARRIWRQLILIEDAMLVYRVVRSPERRVFYIDVGNVPAEDIPNYMEAAQSKLKRSQVVDKSTGRVDLRYNPLSVDEDYFIPVRGDSTGTKIDTLAGGQHVSDIADVEYIQKKLFAALKVPKAYLGYDEALSSKATLAQEDIRFSRSISRIQRVILAELNKLAIVHLYVLGFDGDDLTDFTLHLSNPSTVAQQQKLELYRTRFEIAGTVPERLVDQYWLRKEILGLSDDEIARIKKGLIEDQRLSLQIDAEDVEGAGGGGAGGGFGGLGGAGGDIGGEEGEEDEEGLGGAEGGGAGGEEPAGAGEEEEGGGEEEEDLFAAAKPTVGKKMSLQNALDTIIGDDDDGKKRPRKGPVNSTPTMKRYKYNRSRRKTHGASKTHMPNFKDMVSGNMDPFDKRFFRKNPFGEGLTDSLVSDNEFTGLRRMRPRLTSEMRSILASLDRKISISGRKRTTLISEISDTQVDDDVGLIIEDDRGSGKDE